MLGTTVCQFAVMFYRRVRIVCHFISGEDLEREGARVDASNKAVWQMVLPPIVGVYRVRTPLSRLLREGVLNGGRVVTAMGAVYHDQARLGLTALHP